MNKTQTIELINNVLTDYPIVKFLLDKLGVDSDKIALLPDIVEILYETERGRDILSKLGLEINETKSD